jgi:5'-nucleotidase
LKILVTNDDGIRAPGLWSLVAKLHHVAEVKVVAPERQQSGVGTAVTLHKPLRANRITPQVAGVESYSVEGTPADSVILGLEMLAGDQVDLVISGINHGANIGNDVLISGTVGAALQGYLRGIPAIALSVAGRGNFQFEPAASLGKAMANEILLGSISGDVFLNINLPDLPQDKISGVEVTKVSCGSHIDSVREKNEDGNRLYEIVWSEARDMEEGTDIWAIKTNKISITPLRADLNGTHDLAALKTLCSLLPQNK